MSEEFSLLEMKLSDWILKGIPLVEEDRSVYIFLKPNLIICGCAIGTAYYAKTHIHKLENIPYLKLMQYFSDTFDVPVKILETLSNLHMYGGKNREDCAVWLKERGY